MSTQAKGDATPSLTSQSLQEGLTAKEEELLKWTSFGMLLGMFQSIFPQTVLLVLFYGPLGGFDTVSWISSTNELNCN